MFLKHITIKDKEGFVIRHVDFKKGVNIIKGMEVNTSLVDEQSSTNSIGKTTLLRCIDFCLCGGWQQFTFDKEFKNSKNNTVFEFFKRTLPTFELGIVINLDDAVSAKWVLSRSLLVNARSKTDKSYFSVNNSVDGNEVSEEEYKSKIKEILFDLKASKPTIRQLIPKFIRTSDHQISNVINYLHPSTSNSSYELLHLFLFNFEDIQIVNSKILKDEEVRHKTQEVKSLKDVVGVGTEEINDVRRNELEEQKQLYNSYKIDESYKREDDLLNAKQEELNHIKAVISNTNLNIDVWERRLNEVAENSSRIDAESINYMYQEAGIYNVELQREYEETINFHQNMLKNEIRFISNSIQKARGRLSELETRFRLVSTKYSSLLKELGERGSLADYTKIGNKINELTKEIAENEAIINKYENSRKELSNLKINLEKLIKQVDELVGGDFRRKLTVFNRYFLEYSKDLSDNGYILATNSDRYQHINLVPMPQDKDSNVGDGRKQSLVISFDLAYVSFAKDLSVNIKRPSFFTQDKIEIVDNNMLSKLINLINSTECQFIFPVIEDKLEGLTHFEESNIILCLSEDNKFFDIESYENKKSLLKNSDI